MIIEDELLKKLSRYALEISQEMVIENEKLNKIICHFLYLRAILDAREENQKAYTEYKENRTEENRIKKEFAKIQLEDMKNLYSKQSEEIIKESIL